MAAKKNIWTKVIGCGFVVFVGVTIYCIRHAPIYAGELPSTEVKVNAVNGKHITVQPFFAPQFVLLAEGNVPDKFEAMTCIPRAKEVGSVNGTKFIGTELDCGNKGKFLITEVDFAH